MASPANICQAARVGERFAIVCADLDECPVFLVTKNEGVQFPNVPEEAAARISER